MFFYFLNIVLRLKFTLSVTKKRLKLWQKLNYVICLHNWFSKRFREYRKKTSGLTPTYYMLQVLLNSLFLSESSRYFRKCKMWQNIFIGSRNTRMIPEFSDCWEIYSVDGFHWSLIILEFLNVFQHFTKRSLDFRTFLIIRAWMLFFG